MGEIIRILHLVIKLSFYICFVLLFFVSLKKCFWKEGRSKAKLFVISARLYNSGLFYRKDTHDKGKTYIHEWGCNCFGGEFGIDRGVCIFYGKMASCKGKKVCSVCVSDV